MKFSVLYIRFDLHEFWHNGIPYFTSNYKRQLDALNSVYIPVIHMYLKMELIYIIPLIIFNKNI